MELSGSDCEGANSVTSLNFVLSDPVGMLTFTFTNIE